MSERVHRVREQLEGLLSENVAEVIEREQSTFDNFAGGLNESIVLFGARRLGRKTLRGLRSLGIEPFAFSDNNPQTWGTCIDGVTVYPPIEAAKRFGSDAVFVLTIWGHDSADTMQDRREKLEHIGCAKVIPFVPLYWKFASTFLPHYALDLPHYITESAEDVKRCFEILSDDASKEGFVEQVHWRLTGDFDALSDPVEDEIYFPGFIGSFRAPETFVDCGAYDGDTILRFLALNNNTFNRVFAFEPDPRNFRALEANVSRLPKEVAERIQISPCAVGEESIRVSFAATGTVDSSVRAGTCTVQCVALDEVLRDQNPTYLKMDIESAEPSALRGARNLIGKNQPVIAACSYHLQNHLWTIPLLMFELNPDYVVLQRQHVQLVEDLVSYAVPFERFMGRN